MIIVRLYINIIVRWYYIYTIIYTTVYMYLDLQKQTFRLFWMCLFGPASSQLLGFTQWQTRCIQIVHCSPQSRRFGNVKISFWPRVANMFQTLLLHWLLLGDGAHSGCGGRLQLQRLWRCGRLQLLCHAAVAAVALVAWFWKDLETKKIKTPHTIR
jgi:hypothetical protein